MKVTNWITYLPKVPPCFCAPDGFLSLQCTFLCTDDKNIDPLQKLSVSNNTLSQKLAKNNHYYIRPNKNKGLRPFIVSNHK